MVNKTSMKRLVPIALLLLLSACSFSNRMNNYEARFISQDGVDYKIFNRRGALLQVETPDGVKITADDRDTRPGTLDKLMTILLLKGTP
jgi:uncharacterized lipoprotein